MIPKNQHQQVVYYLLNWNNFSLVDVINHAMFFKFQSRLSDIEAEFGIIAKRTPKKFTNIFGRKSSYFTYDLCIPKEKLMEINEKL